MTSCMFNNSNGPFANVVDGNVYPQFLQDPKRAPTTNDIYPPGTRWLDNSVSPKIIYETVGGGEWDTGGVQPATTTTYGTVILTDNNEPVATQVYVDAIAIAGAPVSTTTTAGIGELATDAEAVAGTASTGVLALFVTPSNLTPVFAAPPSIGGTTPASGAFTNISATGVGTGNILTSDTASNFSTTGAGIDVTIDSASGRVIINGEEAAANAITLLSAAGGIDMDAALLVSISSSRNNENAIELVASAGGINISATGTAGEDIDILATGSSVNITATEDVIDSIVISSSNGGIDITAAAATAGEDIDISAVGSSVNISATENAALAITLNTNGGTSETIRIRNQQGTNAAAVDISATAGGLTFTGGLATADAINIVASDAAGGIDVDAGTGGIAIDSTGAVSIDAAAASNFAVSGAGIDLTLDSAAGQLILTGGEAAANAVRIQADDVAGGIDVDAGTAGFIVDTTGGISLDSAAASNFTATGAFDITIQSTAGSILLNAGEAVSDAINIDSTGGFDLDAALQINIDSSQAAAATSVRIVASAADGGIDVDAGTGGITIDSTGAVSIDGAAASNFSVSGAGIDLTLASSAGRAVVNGGEAAADAVRIQATDAAGGIDVDAGTAGFIVDTTGAISLDSAAASNFTVTGAFDLSLISSAGSVNITAGEAVEDSMVLTNNGLNIVTSGADGRDIDITNTGGSVNITATENVSDAIVINASGAASGMTIDCGTACVTIGTGIKHAVTAVATAATPYAVLGTDYVISTDTTGGVLTLTLPAAPGTGRTLVIYDGAGQAAIGGAVTIDGNGNNIAAGGTSAATKAINTAFESYTLYFNGTIWLGQNVV